mgnify:CR=1 FL=1
MAAKRAAHNEPAEPQDTPKAVGAKRKAPGEDAAVDRPAKVRAPTAPHASTPQRRSAAAQR